MNDDSLTKIEAFHRELCALAATGLPLELGINPTQPALSAKLDQIYSALAPRLRRGSPDQQAIAEQHDLPTQYRTALSIWLRCDDPTVALDRVTTRAVAKRQIGMSLGRSLVYPLIVLVLSYVAFLFLCYMTVPRIEAIYTQLAHQPSESLRFLIASRQGMPIWGPLVPLVLLIGLVWWRWSSKRTSWAWLPGSTRYFRALENADLAQQLARLTEAGLSLEESIELVGPARREPAPVGAEANASMPSLLRWAMEGELDREATPRILNLIAQTYRNHAHRQGAIWRVVTPSICGILLGGAFVLGYCLSLFLPMVQLLKDISIPMGA